MNAVQALRAAGHTGVFTLPALAEKTTDHTVVLPVYGKLES